MTAAALAIAIGTEVAGIGPGVGTGAAHAPGIESVLGKQSKKENW